MNDDEMNNAKSQADSIITLSGINEIPTHFKNILAVLVKHNIEKHGFYAFLRGDERVFVELKQCAS